MYNGIIGTYSLLYACTALHAASVWTSRHPGTTVLLYSSVSVEQVETNDVKQECLHTDGARVSLRSAKAADLCSLLSRRALGWGLLLYDHPCQLVRRRTLGRGRCQLSFARSTPGTCHALCICQMFSSWRLCQRPGNCLLPFSSPGLA